MSEPLDRAKAMHSMKVWLQFIEATLVEHSSSFDEIELSEISTLCSKISDRINVVLVRRST